MNENTFAFSSNVFGWIAGGIPLLVLIISMIRTQLPSNKIKVLEALFKETESTFKGAVEDGLLEPRFIRKVERSMSTLKNEICRLQSIAYGATTLRKDYWEFFKGTSTVIGHTSHKLKELRAEVITSSEERRRRLLEMNRNVPPPPPQSEFLPNILPVQHGSFQCVEFVRPRSCPPSIPRWSGETRVVSAQDDRFCDPLAITSDGQQ